MRLGFRLPDGFDIDFEFGEEQRIFAIKNADLPKGVDIMIGLNFMSLLGHDV
jgi:hypothetical protein